MKEMSQIREEFQWWRAQQNFRNSDDAIDQNFDLKTRENDDYSDQEMFADEDTNDNKSSDKDVPPKNQPRVPQSVVHWSSMQQEIDVENFSRKICSTNSSMTITLIIRFFCLDTVLLCWRLNTSDE